MDYFCITSDLSIFAIPILFIPLTRLFPTTKRLLVHVYQSENNFCCIYFWSIMELFVLNISSVVLSVTSYLALITIQTCIILICSTSRQAAMARKE
jgi:hypothetical protein